MDAAQDTAPPSRGPSSTREAIGEATGLRHGGTLLVEALKAQGVDRVYCIPGESYLAALDGLYESGIETVVARQEGGAAMMAEADGKLTGRPGVAFVTRGPGATNASSGVHVAFQDSTPLVLFVGQVASDQKDREAFQEVDYRAMFGPLAKWVAEVERADRLPEYVSHAFHVAQSGRPGPVVLALPEDMLSAPVLGVEAGGPVAVPAAVLPAGAASEAEIAGILARLEAAERPFVIAGGGGWSAEAAEALGRFAETLQLPVGVSFRCQDYLDNAHPCYAGDVGIAPNPALAARVREADVLLVLGARLGEMTTSGYTLITPPVPRQGVLHVHPDTSELGRVYRPDMAIAARAGVVVCQLAEAAQQGRSKAPSEERAAVLREVRRSYEAWQVPEPTTGALRMEAVIAHLREVLPEDAIVTNGAGNYAGWLHRYYRWRRWRTQLAPTSGSMGYGLPAAVAAKLRHRDREVICLAGDGCFQMVCQELGTAAQYGAGIVVLISNNGMYGTIRMHQERHYPGRPSGTAMRNPDFAALARAYGGTGLTVERDADVAAALAEARAAAARDAMPAVIELKVAPEAISPKMVLGRR